MNMGRRRNSSYRGYGGNAIASQDLERRDVGLLQDSFGRRFSYLRLSVTDACNFRCAYCLPNGYLSCGKKDFLSVAEIRRLIAAFSGLGVTKVRLTGGEPTVRGDIVEIVSAVSEITGIEKIGMTTNGYRLAHLAEALKTSGLSSLNVSVDSLIPEKFKTITGHDSLHDVILGIDRALSLGFSPVKINVVLLRNLNDGEFGAFQEWTRTRSLTIRFIELMRTLTNGPFFENHHLSPHAFKEKLIRNGWAQRARGTSDGPATQYIHPNFQGSIGFIEPYSQDFCASCNRLRVDSHGALRLCLFGEGNFSLRSLLLSDSQKELLQLQIQSLLLRKPISHFLHEGNYGDTPHLAAFGG